MNKKGQGALEYLLLIAGAVLIAAIVLATLTASSAQSGYELEKNMWQAKCAAYSERDCSALIAELGNQKIVDGKEIYCNDPQKDCIWDTTSKKCIANIKCQ